MWSLAERAYPFSQERIDKLIQDSHRLMARHDLGYLKLHERDELWASALERTKHLKEEANRLVVVGMGGSSLGAKAFLQATSGPKETGAGEVLFCDNVDPVSFSRELEKYKDSKDTHWVLVSKSGSTIETLSTASLLLDSMSEPKSRFTVVTEPRSNPLKDWADQAEVPCLEIPVDVGGRFSVFTLAGLLPLAFAGRDLEKIRAGAESALQDMERLVIPLADQYLQSFLDEKWIYVLWSYVDDLTHFGLWFQQLWAESLAKGTRRNSQPASRVSTPLPLRGASDQHSVLQQIMEGARDKLVTFLRVKTVEDFGPVLQNAHFAGQDFLLGKNLGSLLGAEAQATEMALKEAGVPCTRLEGVDLSDHSVAALMQTFMLVIGVMGESLDINAFDQPGVEAGKIITKRLLGKG